MKKYTTDLEISKDLKEAGFPQNTEFSFYQTQSNDILLVKTDVYAAFNSSIINGTRIASPITDELLRELPNVEIYKKEDGFSVWHFSAPSNFKDKKLSNALAKMYIWLKKEVLI